MPRASMGGNPEPGQRLMAWGDQGFRGKKLRVLVPEHQQLEAQALGGLTDPREPTRTEQRP